MGEFVFECVWPDPTAEVQAEAVHFWLAESALSQGKAIERAVQLLIVCRGADGRVAAVSTALPSHVESLGLRCFYFRAFVGQLHRARGLRSSKLIHRLVYESYGVLNQRFHQGIDPDVFGLYLEIENSSILRNRNELVWSDLGANITYIGVLPDGRHARVWYFEDARLPRV